MKYFGIKFSGYMQNVDTNTIVNTIPETSLKYKLGLLISCNPLFNIAVGFHNFVESNY